MPSKPSPPSRGAWIEILVIVFYPSLPPSPPSRGAWIEIIFVVLCVESAGQRHRLMPTLRALSACAGCIGRRRFRLKQIAVVLFERI